MLPGTKINIKTEKIKFKLRQLAVFLMAVVPVIIISFLGHRKTSEILDFVKPVPKYSEMVGATLNFSLIVYLLIFLINCFFAYFIVDYLTRNRTEKAKDEAILESLGDGLVVADSKNGIIIINHVAERMLGWRADEVKGKGVEEVIPLIDEKGEDVPLEKRPIYLAYISGKTTSSNKYYYMRKNKSTFPVSVTVSPIILNGEIIGAIKVFRDITREKEIDKAKNEFVSMASHQLKTPLSAIKWYAEMLLNGDAGALNQEQKDYISEIYTVETSMNELVDSLLNVSRLELGTFVVEPAPVYLGALTEEVLNEVKRPIKEKKLRLERSFEKGMPVLSSDPKLLRVILQNLISNAVKYTPNGGKIKIELATVSQGQTINGRPINQDSMLISVSDTGWGIPLDQQPQIFTKLFRGDNVRAKITDGTGLGLYIVKTILDKVGGEIFFTSKENKGTTFSVILPMAGMKKKAGLKRLS